MVGRWAGTVQAVGASRAGAAHYCKCTGGEPHAIVCVRALASVHGCCKCASRGHRTEQNRAERKRQKKSVTTGLQAVAVLVATR